MSDHDYRSFSDAYRSSLDSSRECVSVLSSYGKPERDV